MQQRKKIKKKKWIHDYRTLCSRRSSFGFWSSRGPQSVNTDRSSNNDDDTVQVNRAYLRVCVRVCECVCEFSVVALLTAFFFS